MAHKIPHGGVPSYIRRLFHFVAESSVKDRKENLILGTIVLLACPRKQESACVSIISFFLAEFTHGGVPSYIRRLFHFVAESSVKDRKENLILGTIVLLACPRKQESACVSIISFFS
jgi:hypothetical protein